MKDANDRELRLGDRVQLWKQTLGKVVCSFDTEAFSDAYPKSDWEHLKIGVLIESDSGQLFHYDESDEDLEIVTDDVAAR